MAWHRMTRNKYKSRKVKLDGFLFDSQKEAVRYFELKLLQQVGQITDLCADKTQLRYVFMVNGIRVGSYRADFRYVENGAVIVEDVKGYKVRDYPLRKKLMQACFNITIRET